MNGISKQSMSRVTVVIVTYQSRGTIDLALRGLAAPHARGLLECVVVDNASSDGTARHIAEAWPWVRLVASGSNLGFGRGCNLGFRSVSTPYVLFLNPDAEIGGDAIATLISFMDAHFDAAIAAPAILDDDGGLQHSGMLMTPGVLVRSALGQEPIYRNSRPILPHGPSRETDWVCGAIMLIRSDAFRAVSGFDPRFFLYFEETDLCLRLRQAGYTIWTVGSAVASHSCGASAKAEGDPLASGCIAEHYYRSRYYYLVKHYGLLRAALAETSSFAMIWTRRRIKRWLGRRTGALDANSSRPLLKMPEQVPDP